MEESQEFPSAKKPLVETLEIAREKSLPMMVNVIGGGRFSGRIKDHNAEALVMWRVTGKENYDIYIPIRHIASIEFEVRVGK
jgi:hypothetical protein